MTERDDKIEVLDILGYAVSELKEKMDPRLIPEVGSNIVYARKGARSPADVAGVEGRIVTLRKSVHPVGECAFGASDHVARIVLTAMRFDPEIRSAANIRFTEPLAMLIEDMSFSVCWFDREDEPPGIQTMDWGVASCCRDEVPDMILDRGAVGKEPMIRILGTDPSSVANTIIMLSSRITTMEI
ncbi:MAG: Phosphomethylpyrimidine kinase [Methanomicrobiales archaeon 53_19]|jgi:hydroxymethylpyrimidine/phosphomethylpyrimidine kinase|uniref:thiamine-phosphate synthase family protein n=1 Tax=Methanocalculus sp. TaxID=2004547 RepID=UPI00074A93C4|nr:thiamine-phosphate synthase family protein [Methanocalculus sp.]KUK69831.1 MAG: Phosphomethylpyrimidine kinase [Methanocalculus sp. 52_23]KUL04302.1 MAG: Phosphomethylpyrimidine kinase [Methanomicrobiales archaeon 53_19]HIJ06057.1 phosphomethylpyrimidine kinase [Methanocalculus sp.]